MFGSLLLITEEISAKHLVGVIPFGVDAFLVP